MHGLGTFLWNDGRKYTGSWQNNKMDGKGTYFWPDGRRYEGYYKQDQKEGQGTYRWADGKFIILGKVYEGQWNKGQMHGNGFIIEKNQKTPVQYEAGVKIK